MQKVYKKDSRKAISADPERQIFKIFTLVPTRLDSKVFSVPYTMKVWVQIYDMGNDKQLLIWIFSGIFSLHGSSVLSKWILLITVITDSSLVISCL